LKMFTVSKRTLTIFPLTLCLIGYLMVGCSASLAYLMSVEEMTEKADVILVGTVESIFHCPADPAVPRMHRQVYVSVERYLKNPLNQTSVTVVALGATIGNTGMWVEDQPEFHVSERVLLFLRDDPWFLEGNQHGFYQIIGECQGKFAVEEESAISKHGLIIHDGYEFQGIKFEWAPEVKPAEFEVSDLSITPDKVKLGWNAIISFTVTNIGEQTGSYFVNLKIDGVPTAGMTGELEPGESEVRSYWLTPKRPGDYSVEVDGRIGSFTSEAPPPIVIKPTPPKLAEFEVIVNDFQVHPLGIEVEDEDDVWTFRISYNVTNVGDYYGNYSVRSKIDGMAVDSNVFFLEAGETQSYLFEVERGIGTYQVEVEEFTESIEVTLIHKRSFWDEIPGFPYESIIIGLIAIISILRARNLNR